MISEISTHEVRLRQLGHQIKLSKLRRSVLSAGAERRARDRRRHYRVRTDWPLRFRTAACGDSTDATIGNLSERGMFVRTHNLPEPGTIVAGAYRTEAGVVGFRGRVAWVYRHPDRDERGFGIAFTRVGTHALPAP